MLEQTVSSSSTFWAVLYSWFTPTVFFLLLQLVIGTIYVTSILSNATHNHKHEQDPIFQQNQLYRSPSVLQRLKSINFYSYPYRSHDVVTTHTPQIHTHTPTQNDNPQPPPLQQQQLGRSPSSVLQRLKSINLYSYFPTEPLSNVFSTEKTREPEKRHVAVMEKQHEKEDEEGEGEYQDDDVLGNIRDNLGRYEDVGKGKSDDKFASLDEVFRLLQGQGGNFTRSHSDTKPESGEVPVKLPKKMKKSASSKSAFGHFKEEDIVESRRPATARETKVAPVAAADDHEVDAKADDFINKFKQQLKLQRLDSIMRYKDMINRGT